MFFFWIKRRLVLQFHKAVEFGIMVGKVGQFMRNLLSNIDFYDGIFGGFLKWCYPTTIGFPTKNDHFGVFWGYHHFRKQPIWNLIMQFPICFYSSSQHNLSGTCFNPSRAEVGNLPPLVGGHLKKTCFPIFDPPPEHGGSLNHWGSIWGSTEGMNSFQF